MNRQEIISQLKLIQAGLTQDDNNKSKNRIDTVIENLKQPITLADFLGWEENAIYTDGNVYYKIQNGNLFLSLIHISINFSIGKIFLYAHPFALISCSAFSSVLASALPFNVS